MRRASSRALRDLARADLAAAPRAADRRAADDLVADLLGAIERDELALHFQPIVDLRDHACRRAEALLRWTHLRHGAIDPRDIVRVAETGGLARPLLMWVIRRAARQRERWAREGLELGLSINMCGADLADGGADAIVRTIATTGARPGIFTFELPASRATPGLLAELRRLAEAGARVALDDVTGADRLPRSLEHQVDEVKLGRTVMRRALAEPRARAELRLLLEEAHDLDVARVAVGIEDLETLELVSAAGCEFAQGYWVSRPLGVDDKRWRGAIARVALGGTAALAAFLGIGRAATVVPVANAGPAATALVTDPNSGATCCALQQHGSVRDVGLALRTLNVSGASVHVESSIGAAEEQRITAAVARDVVGVTQDFGVQFSRTPDVYVFGSRASFALALQNGFGQRATDAAALSVANGGVAFATESAIVINLQNADASLSVVRHELTHLVIHQTAGTSTNIPAWFDEGLATLSQRAVSPDAVTDARDASTTLALLREGRTSLTNLSSPSEWTIANAQLGGRAYAYAAEAVRLIDSSLGLHGVTAMLSRSHDVGFAQAFGESLGLSPADFAHDFAARYVSAQAPQVVSSPSASGVLWSATGFVPESRLHITIAGDDYHLEFDVQADRDGTYSALFGGTAPAGDYAVLVTSGTTTASGSLHIGAA